MYPLNDREYEDHVLTSVSDAGSNWNIGHGGWHFLAPKQDAPEGFAPQPGMTARFYGKGMGHVVRGLFIDGVRLFYRTETEQTDRHRQECLAREQEQKYDYERVRADHALRKAALPPVFQDRFARFHANNPDFGWKFEAYELFTCEQAVVIATRVQADDIAAFREWAWEQQKAAVPELSDGHSGNTFVCACLLAHTYLTRPELVPQIHGAMASLAGCKDYGCH